MAKTIKVSGMNVRRMNEFDLILFFRQHMKFEEYTQCQHIQDEVNRRIDSGTLDLRVAVDGFRRIDTGEVDYSKDYGRLFAPLREKYPHLFNRQAAAEYLLKLPCNNIKLSLA